MELTCATKYTLRNSPRYLRQLFSNHQLGLHSKECILIHVIHTRWVTKTKIFTVVVSLVHVSAWGEDFDLVFGIRGPTSIKHFIKNNKYRIQKIVHKATFIWTFTGQANVYTVIL